MWINCMPSFVKANMSCSEPPLVYKQEILMSVNIPQDKSYNPDNLRKAWDSCNLRAKFLPDENLATLYQMNTGHCETTREKYYIQPATDGEFAKLLDNQLQLLNDEEFCYDKRLPTQSSSRQPMSSRRDKHL